MDTASMKEILSELYSHLERLETQSTAMLLFLKEKKRVTDKQLAPYIERAGNAANVRWRAERVRMEYLLTQTDVLTGAFEQTEKESSAPSEVEQKAPSEDAQPAQGSGERDASADREETGSENRREVAQDKNTQQPELDSERRTEVHSESAHEVKDEKEEGGEKVA